MNEPVLCPWCQRQTRPVWVHGHGQCEHCHINIEPCCSGASCEGIPEASISLVQLEGGGQGASRRIDDES